jgi:Phage integrase, N-terminal SAM-like domain/Phage integrase family
MNSPAPIDPALQPLLVQVANALQKQGLPAQRAAWRMRWVERFISFLARQAAPGSLAKCQERFVYDVSSTQSATPWLMREIEEAISVFVELVEKSELTHLLGSKVLLPIPPIGYQPVCDRRPIKLIDQIRCVIRAKHYSRRTEEAYVHWARQYVLFHGKRHPLELGELEVASFLENLAVNKAVAASTQNQALNALVFLYGTVLQKPLGKLGSITRAKRPQRLPSVLTQAEVQGLLAAMNGHVGLMARLLYGAGLRLTECVNLRVKDLNLDTNQPPKWKWTYDTPLRARPQIPQFIQILALAVCLRSGKTRVG